MLRKGRLNGILRSTAARATSVVAGVGLAMGIMAVSPAHAVTAPLVGGLTLTPASHTGFAGLYPDFTTAGACPSPAVHFRVRIVGAGFDATNSNMVPNTALSIANPSGSGYAYPSGYTFSDMFMNIGMSAPSGTFQVVWQCIDAAGVNDYGDFVSNVTFTHAQTDAAYDGSYTSSPASVAVPGAYTPVSPARLLDTRDGTGGVPVAKVDPGASVAFQVAGAPGSGVPASGAGAVVLNVTVTDPTTEGFITAYPSGATAPLASNLNFKPQQTIPNHVTVKLGADGKVALKNGSTGTVNLLADVAGWYAAGNAAAPGTFTPMSPVRLLDTRDGTGGVPVGQVAAQGVLPFAVAGAAGIPAAASVGAGALNVTVTGPHSEGFITAFPNLTPKPLASNLNFQPGQTIPNAVTSKTGTDGKVALFNGSTGGVDLIADVAGYFLSGTPSVSGAFNPLAPARLLDTRDGTGTTAAAKIPAHGSVTFAVANHGNVPAEGAGAAVLNVTVTDPGDVGFITAYPAGTTQPLASNLNFVPGQTIPNLVTVKLGSSGQVTLYNGSGSPVNLIADVAGYYRS